MFPRIKVKRTINPENVKKLKKDLKSLKSNILDFAPSGFGSRDLNDVRIRVFKFPEKDDCDEFFTRIEGKKYVCLNLDLLNRDYFAGLQYALHGIAHSFCNLNGVGQEVFCEVVSYNILRELLKNRDHAFRQRVFRRILCVSPEDYNTYHRVGRRLEKRRSGFLYRLNDKACDGRILEKDERKIFQGLIRLRAEEDEETIPDLEKGFKRI